MKTNTEYNDLTQVSLDDLRQLWSVYWGHMPPMYVGRKMLEDSVSYKVREQNGEGLTPKQQRKLNDLISAYKRDPNSFEDRTDDMKPGTRLLRTYRGVQHTVEVIDGGYIYKGMRYSSLSKIAREITSTSWNGWRFFGLTKPRDIS
jgi:hypothetical protein